MKNELVLLVDKNHVETKQVIDVVKGQVRQATSSAGDFCEELGVRCAEMTPAIKGVVLYERKNKDGGEATPVKLGDLGPFVLCRVVDDQVVNKFGVHDICKPMRLSADTVRQLAEIFGGEMEEE